MGNLMMVSSERSTVNEIQTVVKTTTINHQWVRYGGKKKAETSQSGYGLSIQV